MAKLNWHVIHECDDENDQPTCWGVDNVDGHYMWVTIFPDGLYHVEKGFYGSIIDLKSFKTLERAKRYADSLV